jgi:protein-L-isoaspartate O-methyltransferase
MGIRAAEPSDVDTVSHMLADGFLVSPIGDWLIPDRDIRHGVHHPYLRLHTERALTVGRGARDDGRQRRGSPDRTFIGKRRRAYETSRQPHMINYLSLLDTQRTAPMTGSSVRRRLGYLRQVEALQPSMAGWVADAMAAVPRHVFLSRLLINGREGWTDVIAGDARHLDLSYSVRAWSIQLDSTGVGPGMGDDNQTGPMSATPSAYCTDPATVAAMLTAADIEPGMRVLSMPTGSGYLTALLAWRLAGDLVVSIDTDRELVMRARAALEVCDLAATVDVGTMTGPRRRGPRADRLIAAGRVPYIPPTWLDAVRPGGRIVAGVGRLTWHNRPTPLVVLTVGEDGSAHGRLVRHAASLPPLDMAGPPTLADVVPPDTAELTEVAMTPTDLDAALLADADFAAFAVLFLPELTLARPDRRGRYWFAHRDRSIAAVVPAAGQIVEYGTTAISDRLHAARDAWRQAGSPTIDALRVTLDPTRSRLHVDNGPP